MDGDVILGLRLSVIGLSLTFLALGLLILVMVLLLRFFPEKEERPQKAADTAPREAEATDEQRLEEMAVALAVGICVLEKKGALDYRDPSLGKLLEQN